MATNENDGPLTKLMRGLGIDEKLAPIAAVKRITERPVSLNAETLFKMAPTPDLMSDTGIHKLEEFKAEFDLRGMDIRYEFKGSFRGRQTWWCWDAVNGQETVGEGETKRDALVDFLDNREVPKPKAGYVVHSSPYEPPEVRDVVDRSEDDVDFDDGLTDDDAR